MAICVEVLETPRGKTDWEAVDRLSDAEIAAGIASDKDAAPILSKDWFARARARAYRKE